MNRILLVDDNLDMRQMLKAALEMEGFAVQEAANGREADRRRRDPVQVRRAAGSYRGCAFALATRSVSRPAAFAS